MLPLWLLKTVPTTGIASSYKTVPQLLPTVLQLLMRRWAERQPLAKHTSAVYILSSIHTQIAEQVGTKLFFFLKQLLYNM